MEITHCDSNPPVDVLDSVSRDPVSSLATYLWNNAMVSPRLQVLQAPAHTGGYAACASIEIALRMSSAESYIPAVLLSFVASTATTVKCIAGLHRFSMFTLFSTHTQS